MYTHIFENYVSLRGVVLGASFFFPKLIKNHQIFSKCYVLRISVWSNFIVDRRYYDETFGSYNLKPESFDPFFFFFSILSS